MLQDAALRSLDGDELSLTHALDSRERMLLFWDPACGYCRRILDDLQSFESLGAPGTAVGLRVDAAGRMASGVAVGGEALLTLVRDAAPATA